MNEKLCQMETISDDVRNISDNEIKLLAIFIASPKARSDVKHRLLSKGVKVDVALFDDNVPLFAELGSGKYSAQLVRSVLSEIKHYISGDNAMLHRYLGHLKQQSIRNGMYSIQLMLLERRCMTKEALHGKGPRFVNRQLKRVVAAYEHKLGIVQGLEEHLEISQNYVDFSILPTSLKVITYQLYTEPVRKDLGADLHTQEELLQRVYDRLIPRCFDHYYNVLHFLLYYAHHYPRYIGLGSEYQKEEFLHTLANHGYTQEQLCEKVKMIESLEDTRLVVDEKRFATVGAPYSVAVSEKREVDETQEDTFLQQVKTQTRKKVFSNLWSLRPPKLSWRPLVTASLALTSCLTIYNSSIQNITTPLSANDARHVVKEMHDSATIYGVTQNSRLQQEEAKKLQMIHSMGFNEHSPLISSASLRELVECNAMFQHVEQFGPLSPQRKHALLSGAQKRGVKSLKEFTERLGHFSVRKGEGISQAHLRYLATIYGNEFTLEMKKSLVKYYFDHWGEYDDHAEEGERLALRGRGVERVG